MNFDQTKANEARVASALLALGIQRKNLISHDDFEKVLRYTNDSLNKIGVYVNINELNRIDQMTADEAVAVVNRIKAEVINGIGSSCGSVAAALFELTFNFYLVVTTPEIIPAVEPALTQMASVAGFQNDVVSAILEKAKNDTDSAIADFESATDEVIGASTETSSDSLLDVIELKPGIGGVSFDVKKAFSLASKWITNRKM